MQKSKIKNCIVIPVYNEKENIRSTIMDIQSKCGRVDIIVIDDGSTDGTQDLARELGCRVIPLSTNLGIGGAVQTGFLYAENNNYDVVIRMDGDGQHDPKYIGDMIECISNEYADIVIGSRYIDRKGYQSTLIRRIGGALIKSLIYALCSVKVQDPTSGYWAMNSKAVHLFSRFYQQDYPEPEAILTASIYGLNILELPVEMRDRNSGKSTIDVWHSLYYMAKVSLSLLFERINQGNANDITEI